MTPVTADTDSISMRVVDAIASERNCAPTDIEPLANSIDPEALDEILESAGGTAVSFDHAGYTVQASTKGTHTSIDITRNIQLCD